MMVFVVRKKMKILEREIGNQVDSLFETVLLKLANSYAKNKTNKSDAEKKLTVLPQKDGLLSRIKWMDGNPYIYIRSDVPTHALPHIFGTALCHVHQRIDNYPDVVRNESEKDLEGSLLARTTLKELVLSLNAENLMKDIKFNMKWENSNRHQGFKDLLSMLDRGSDDSFISKGSPVHQFFAMIYAKYSLQHPASMWKALRKDINNDFPEFLESGENVVAIIKDTGYDDEISCLKTLISIRDELNMRPYTLITDKKDQSFY